MKVVLTVALLCLLSLPIAWAEPVSTAQVRTQPLSTHDLAQALTGYGVIIGQPTHAVNLNLPTPGRVDAVLLSPGQMVKKGQPLLRVDTDPTVRQAYTQAETALRFANRDLERQQTLLAQQLATNAQVEAAKRAVQDANQTLVTQRALGNGNTTTVLAAPEAGVVTAIGVSAGDRFAAGTTLAQLAASNAMQARLALLPEEAVRVHAGNKVHLHAVFEPARTAEGVVDLVAGQIDPANQRVDVIVPLTDSILLPGTRVIATITVGQRKTTAVPRQAVLHDERGAYVFQVVNARAHRVTVSTAEESQGMVAVSGPLAANSPVVVLGNYELKDGMSVREGTQ